RVVEQDLVHVRERALEPVRRGGRCEVQHCAAVVDARFSIAQLWSMRGSASVGSKETGGPDRSGPPAPRRRQCGDFASGLAAPAAGAAGFAGASSMPSSSTSKTSVAPGLIFGGAPRSPYAVSDGQTSFALPPTFIFCTPS